MKKRTRDIGIGLRPPEKTCEDKNCCWHGKLPVRGRVIEGVVVSTRAQKTAVVEKNYLHYVPKYETYERRHSRIIAYNPECVSAKTGDKVKIAECRPLGKTKHFIVVGVAK